MSAARELALQYARNNREKFLTELKKALAIPSISTNTENVPDMKRAADWLADELKTLGFEHVRAYATPRHPIVYADWLHVENAPTVLIYGHYDVQPVDPIDLWETAPFEPTQRGENLYARGASDMKGQVAATLKALEAIVSAGELPVNIKFIIEGEEEIGSPSLAPFMRAHKDLLAADFCLNPDAGMLGQELPSITYALRGLAYFEIRFFGPDHDLHSGLFGGVVRNPANELMNVIAGMKDENGRITLPGFYDKVRELDEAERAELARLPMKDDFYLAQTGSSTVWGEAGYTSVERAGARPTLDVNGMLAGFTGEGAKTVLPAHAMAKISMRLVPDQNPNEVHRQLLQYLEAHVPDGIRWEVEEMHGGFPSISQRDTAGVKALAAAMETVWGVRPLFKREGGSIPVVADMQQILGIESALTGFGLPDDHIHAPNEKQHLPTWYRGIETLIHFFYNLG